jgi:hypothetical protein
MQHSLKVSDGGDDWTVPVIGRTLMVQFATWPASVSCLSRLALIVIVFADGLLAPAPA